MNERRYFELSALNGAQMGRFWVRRSYINDSTTRLWFFVPKVYSDGSRLNLTIRYVRLIDANGNRETGVGCDSLFFSNILAVQGGSFEPTITNISQIDFQRLDTVTAILQFKGINLLDANFNSIRFFTNELYEHIYNMLAQSIEAINDSTIKCSFVVPYHIPNGSYIFVLNSNGTNVYCYNQLVTIAGNKAIPAIKKVMPDTIQRGIRTKCEIQIESISLLQLGRVPKVITYLTTIEDVKVKNDSTLIFSVLPNLINSHNVNVSVELYEGQPSLSISIPLSYNKPAASVFLQKLYIFSQAKTDTIVVKGINTHFKQGTVELNFEDSTVGSIEDVSVLDSVTIEAIVKIDNQLPFNKLGAHYFTFSDDESPIKTRVGSSIFIVSESEENKLWKMDPPYFYRGKQSTYYFHLLNDIIRLKSITDKWSLKFKGINSGYHPELFNCNRLDDSTIICDIIFQESFNDLFCSVDFRYNSTRVGLNIQSLRAVQMVATGIEEQQKEKQALWVYPNPTSGSITLNIQNEEFEPISLKIIDITGKQVVEDKFSPEKVLNFNYDLNVGNGLYFLELKTTDGIYLSKISIQK